MSDFMTRTDREASHIAARFVRATADTAAYASLLVSTHERPARIENHDQTRRDGGAR
jgi:hypothetical protein